MIQRRFLQRLAALFEPVFELKLHPVEFTRISPLKGIDRLFLIPNNKDRAQRICARTLARCEFLGQLPDHIPLRWARILRLVHQDMVDPAVDPIQHPSRDTLVRQQCARLANQIVKIQPPALMLVIGVSFQECRAKGRKRCRSIRPNQRAIGILQLDNLFGHVHRILECFGDSGLYLLGAKLRCNSALCRQKRVD